MATTLRLPSTAPTTTTHSSLLPIPELSRSPDTSETSDDESVHEGCTSTSKVLNPPTTDAGPSQPKVTPEAARKPAKPINFITRQRIRDRLAAAKANAAVNTLNWLEGRTCCIQPYGSCRRVNLVGSAYCVLHSCPAINADGSACYNLVSNPADSKYCKYGWHSETNRDKPLADLMEHRKQYDRLAALDRSNEISSHFSYFEEHFSSAGSSSGRASDSPRVAPIPMPSRNEQQERPWGAHGVDKWWVGEWNNNQRRGAASDRTYDA